MKKSGFTRSDYSQFLRLRDAGVSTEAISRQLKITETCIARAVANLEPPKLTPAQKGAATKAANADKATADFK